MSTAADASATSAAAAATSAATSAGAAIVAKPPGVLKVAFRLWRTRSGALIALALSIVAIFGRYFAPYGEQKGIAKAFQPAAKTRLPSKFGSAKVGHDVWTRFLYDGLDGVHIREVQRVVSPDPLACSECGLEVRQPRVEAAESGDVPPPASLVFFVA